MKKKNDGNKLMIRKILQDVKAEKRNIVSYIEVF